MFGTNVQKLISTAKRLTDLPHNKFDLELYKDKLLKHHLYRRFHSTPYFGVIRQMAGGHDDAGIVDTSMGIDTPEPRIILIGKGMLFDSGGYNLKTGKHLADMHVDKAGMVIALTVAKYFDAVEKRLNNKHVVAYCPVTTNFLHTSKLTPGDIVQIGKHEVCINNTDAEGRLIIAEALTLAPIRDNDVVITIATLTGCCEYAVDKATGVLGSPELTARYLLAAKQAKEYAWTLPMFDYMQKHYKKDPILNAQDKIKAGTSEGAMFIKQFVKYPKNWIHLDIASSAFDDRGKANGVPIKSLIRFIAGLTNTK